MTNSDIISDDSIAKINQIGGSYVDELYRDLTRERFLKYARQFTDHVGLATPNIKKVFDLMDPEGYTFTMAMFGEVAYTVQLKDETENILSLLEQVDCEPVVCQVDEHGTVLL